ncbi:hypothetical protein BDW22DRAFT_1351851 [Trametopsis cervina]|nr:hypothetical protein BDW22DRAFT_1351851 [Trametopsis cervina]
MQFRVPAVLAAFMAVLSIGSVVAMPGPTEVQVAHSGDGSISLTEQSGCGSSGPLGTGHFIWYIVVSCNPGATLTCQATDATGCLPGNAKHIGSMEVDDPNDTVQYAKKSNTNSVIFVCPSGGQVRCEANFNDNDDGPNYSLRVF